jgi:hypothetical protein
MTSKSKNRKLLETTAPAPSISTEPEASAETETLASAGGDLPRSEASAEPAPHAAQIKLPDKTGPPETLSDDLLIGAGAIARFLYGTVSKRRAVYHLAEKGVLPGFKWGGVLVARKSTLLKFLAAREREALASIAAE